MEEYIVFCLLLLLTKVMKLEVKEFHDNADLAIQVLAGIYT